MVSESNAWSCPHWSNPDSRRACAGSIRWYHPARDVTVLTGWAPRELILVAGRVARHRRNIWPRGIGFQVVRIDAANGSIWTDKITVFTVYKKGVIRRQGSIVFANFGHDKLKNTCSSCRLGSADNSKTVPSTDRRTLRHTCSVTQPTKARCVLNFYRSRSSLPLSSNPTYSNWNYAKFCVFR
jgi:hypothetical protein